jgi:hypothetical protein
MRALHSAGDSRREERVGRWVVKNGKPWLLLVPNYVYMKDYYQRSLGACRYRRSQTESPLITPTREVRTPSSLTGCGNVPLCDNPILIQAYVPVPPRPVYLREPKGRRRCDRKDPQERGA